MATSVLKNAVGQGLFSWQTVGIVSVQLTLFSSSSQNRVTRSVLLHALNCWGRSFGSSGWRCDKPIHKSRQLPLGT